MPSAVYQKPYGAMAVYYGISETLTNWPDIMGGFAHTPVSFLSGQDNTYGGAIFASTLRARALRVYSNVQGPTFFNNRFSFLPPVLAVGLWGPQRAVFPLNSLPNPSPWTGVPT